MERSTPVRNPHTSTADLLSWSETPPPDHSSPSAARSHQPSDGISKVLGGGQITDEEAQSLNKLKNCSGYKLKEMTGSGIFTLDEPAGGQSNILFSEEPEVKTSKKIHDQKFQELTGNGIFKGDESPGTGDKQLSSAKLREMSGNNIFADGKSESRDYFGGVRKPPGGESSISLV
ncbi:hypothetical protein F2Q68_00028593 [Brassica cretica]|uniref:DUF4057 domain-containing protein n=1 Tax=Brassica cretica TaxID=69181 RepID=A0A8S9G7H3_BRACR|nr:hypothetical protein F2Q68_00028593 [Brassica cretica]